MEDRYWGLVVRVLSDEASPAERAVLSRWVESNPAHREELETACALWEATRAIPVRSDVDAAWERVAGRISELRGDASKTHPRLLTHESQRARTVPLRHAASVAILLRIAAMLLLVLGGALWASESPAVRSRIVERTVATGRAERAELTLGDGTRVLLGAESRLRYARRFGADARDVHLEGTAYFEVVHDAERPFTVRSPHAITRVLGTRFSVRDTEGSESARVVVAEGRVSVRKPSAGAPAAILTRGQSARVTGLRPVAVLDSVDLTRELAWTQRRVELWNAPVREVLEEVDQWYGVRIVVPDSSLAARHITISFGEEELDTILREIALALGARVEARGPELVLLPARGADATSPE